jgi:hypothetical protein
VRRLGRSPDRDAGRPGATGRRRCGRGEGDAAGGVGDRGSAFTVGDDPADHRDEVGIDDPIDRQLVLTFEAIHVGLGGRTELAVDRRWEPGEGEVLLKHADVMSGHPLLQHALAEVLGRGKRGRSERERHDEDTERELLPEPHFLEERHQANPFSSDAYGVS